MASSVGRLIAAHTRSDAGSLRALGVALAATVRPPTPLPTDPVELLLAVEDRDTAEPGTWGEVAAARDTGALTGPEYDYLSAAVEALTMDEENR